jgi:indole-3-glycerol phosphate synthase
MNLLETILEKKRQEIADACAKTPLPQLIEAAMRTAPPRGFLTALECATGMALIAEIKKASPSRGVIREDFDPVELAKAYQRGGATCLSVLTDEQFFQGLLDYLRAIRKAVELPLLRKDFLIDAYQIVEARVAGADAVLLIVRALDSDAEKIKALANVADDWGMDALVEVHDGAEMDVAIEAGARLIGINNRDLTSFETDLAVTERLGSMAEEETLLVSESGIFSHSDVERVRMAGARAVLVGESLMKEDDVEEATRRLMSA